MKKLIILFLILGILVVGCSNSQTYTKQPTQPPPSPAIGGGCGVVGNEEQTKIKYVGVG